MDYQELGGDQSPQNDTRRVYITYMILFGGSTYDTDDMH